MPEFKKSKGFKMKGPQFFASALKKYGKSPVKQMGVQPPTGQVPPPQQPMPQQPMPQEQQAPAPTMKREGSPAKHKTWNAETQAKLKAMEGGVSGEESQKWQAANQDKKVFHSKKMSLWEGDKRVEKAHSHKPEIRWGDNAKKEESPTKHKTFEGETKAQIQRRSKKTVEKLPDGREVITHKSTPAAEEYKAKHKDKMTYHKRNIQAGADGVHRHSEDGTVIKAENPKKHKEMTNVASPTKKGKFKKIAGAILTGGASLAAGGLRKRRKAKKAAKASGAMRAERKAKVAAASPAKKRKAGKIIGNILTGGVSGGVCKIRAKRKAKRAAKKGKGAAPATAPAKMHTPDHHNIAMPGKELERKTYKGGNPKGMMI